MTTPSKTWPVWIIISAFLSGPAAVAAGGQLTLVTPLWILGCVAINVLIWKKLHRQLHPNQRLMGLMWSTFGFVMGNFFLSFLITYAGLGFLEPILQSLMLISIAGPAIGGYLRGKEESINF